MEGRTKNELEGVSLLGNQNTKYRYDYDPSVLETFVNKYHDNDYVVTFDAYEFTSLCPKTGQPDLAKVVISYIPDEKMVESKSLKLYLFSFRNHGDFHEDCMNIVMKDLIKLLNPKYIEVKGIFAPRGGISIFPFCNWSNPEFNYANFAKLRMQDALRDASNRKVRYDI
jgi:7-cyano-7-deazaguanine reductase